MMVLTALFDGGKGNHTTHETTAFYLSLSLSLCMGLGHGVK